MARNKQGMLMKKTSLEVFNSFTRRDAYDKLVFESIISIECFKEWVATRIGQLKNPKGAFRRTIYAHLRGADGRAPFAQDVEVSILRNLRNVSPTGQPVDPFRAIFGNCKKFKRSTTGGWLPAFKYPYGHHEKHQYLLQSKSPSLSRGSLRNGPENVDDLCSVENFLRISRNEMMNFLEQGKQVSMNFNCSAVIYLVNLMSSSSYFLSKEFILPALREQYFKKECILFAAFQLTRDQNFLSTFGELFNPLQLAPSVTEFFTARREVSPLLQRGESVWFRGTMLLKGVRYVFKTFIKKSSPGVEKVVFQVEFDNIVHDQVLNRILV
eukprot:snap_masked-scaffold_53-processed-gene-1.63-mRNA-1 protein AED:1.00 eAED:1.00 QI:0/0/0/0/1/1/5/0/324